MPDVLHAARDTWYCPTVEDVCEECGKQFKRTDDHAYTRYIGYKRRWYCSYTCFRVWEREQEALNKLDEEPEEPSELEKAERRVAQCREGLAGAEKRKKRASRSVERRNAQTCIRKWAKKLSEAEARLEKLQKGDLG